MGSKSEKKNIVENRNVFNMVDLEEYKEELEETVTGGGGDDIIIMQVVYRRGTVRVLSHGYFSSVGSSSRFSHSYLPLFLGAGHIQE